MRLWSGFGVMVGFFVYFVSSWEGYFMVFRIMFLGVVFNFCGDIIKKRLLGLNICVQELVEI